MMGGESSFPRAFYLGLAAALLLFFGLQALFPTLPLYVLHLGGEPADNGLAIWVFALSALLLRPLGGALADRWGCRPVLLIGAFLFGAGPFLYILSWNVPSLLVARVVHGGGMALYSNAYRALATFLSPPGRRGEGLGMVGLASTVTTALAPLTGEWLVRVGSFPLLFAVLGGLGLVGWAMLLGLPQGEAPATGSAFAGLRSALSSSEIRLSAAAMGFLGVPYGGLVGFLPLLAQARELGPTGWAYTTYTVAAIVGGPLAGWISDRFGRQRVIAPGALVVTVAQLGLALVGRRWGLLGLTALYGLGWGALRTGVDALVQDSVDSGARNSAVAAQYTGFDLGVGGGSLGLGALAETVSYTAAYGLAGGAALLGLGLLTLAGEPTGTGNPRQDG